MTQRKKICSVTDSPSLIYLLFFFPCLFLHQGKGEVVRGAEAHFGPAARPRGSWAAPTLSMDTQREDKKAQGHFTSLSSYQSRLIVSLLHDALLLYDHIIFWVPQINSLCCFTLKTHSFDLFTQVVYESFPNLYKNIIIDWFDLKNLKRFSECKYSLWNNLPNTERRPAQICASLLSDTVPCEYQQVNTVPDSSSF